MDYKGLLTRNEGRGRGGGRGGRRRGGGKSDEKYVRSLTYSNVVANMLQGMATSHQTRKTRKGRQNQEYGRDLPSFASHQRVSDCRFLPSEAEGLSWIHHVFMGHTLTIS